MEQSGNVGWLEKARKSILKIKNYAEDIRSDIMSIYYVINQLKIIIIFVYNFLTYFLIEISFKF